MIIASPFNAGVTSNFPTAVMMSTVTAPPTKKPSPAINTTGVFSNVPTTANMTNSANVPLNTVKTNAAVIDPETNKQKPIEIPVSVSEISTRESVQMATKKSKVCFVHSVSNCSAEWSYRALETLIKMFKHRQFLYVPLKGKYVDKTKRKKAFIEIAAGLSQLRPSTTPEEVKKRLQALKREFLQEMRCLIRIKEMDRIFVNPDENLESKYWVFPRMKFLLPFVRDGPYYLASSGSKKPNTIDVDNIKIVNSFSISDQMEFTPDQMDKPTKCENEENEESSELGTTAKRRKTYTLEITERKQESVMSSLFNYLLLECSRIQDQSILNNLKSKLFTLVMESVQLDNSKCKS